MFRLEKMRLQGLRYDLPTHEGCQKTGLYSTTIRKVELWLKENKNQEELTYISDLTTSLLHYPHLFSRGVHLCLASVLTNCFSLGSPTCCCAMSLGINFVPAFTVFASMINAFFTGEKDPGKKQLLASSPCWFGGQHSWFHPGFPGSLPGEGIKILFHTATCCWLAETTVRQSALLFVRWDITQFMNCSVKPIGSSDLVS